MGTAILWVAIVLIALGLVGYIMFFTKWKRSHQLRKLSADLGLAPEAETSVLESSGLLEAAWLESDGARLSNVLRGEVRGAEAYVFDFVKTDAGRRRAPDSVVFFHLRQGSLPQFELRPRGSKEPRGLGFDTHPRFSEIYSVSGSDEKAIRDVFRPDVLDFFERGENQSWAVTSTGEWVATAFWPLGERERALHPKEVMGFVEDAKEVLFVLSAS